MTPQLSTRDAAGLNGALLDVRLAGPTALLSPCVALKSLHVSTFSLRGVPRLVALLIACRFLPNVPSLFAWTGVALDPIGGIWLADQMTRLRQVVIGVPFTLYNEDNRLNRLPTARPVSRSLPSYYLSPLVTKTSVLVLATAATGRSFVSETPPMSREAFWQFQLGPGADLYCRRWSRPRVLLARLEEVARRCRESGIDLVFFIPPADP